MKAETSHITVEIENPFTYLLAKDLAAGILRAARIYSITRRPLVAAYDIAKLNEVSPRLHEY